MESFQEWKSSMSKPKLVYFYFYFSHMHTCKLTPPPHICNPKIVNKYLHGPNLGYFLLVLDVIFNIPLI